MRLRFQLNKSKVRYAGTAAAFVALLFLGACTGLRGRSVPPDAFVQEGFVPPPVITPQDSVPDSNLPPALWEVRPIESPVPDMPISVPGVTE